MRKRLITVLCVDADSFGLDVRRMVLEKLGCKVATCTHGDAALAELNSRHFDAVLMDFVIEGMRGDELARAIKTARPSTPVLMLSNLVYPPESALPYIDGFATKGDSPRAILALIEKSLRASGRKESRLERGFWISGIAFGGAAWLFSKIIDRGHARKRESDTDPEVDRSAPQSGMTPNHVAHA